MFINIKLRLGDRPIRSIISNASISHWGLSLSFTISVYTYRVFLSNALQGELSTALPNSSKHFLHNLQGFPLTILKNLTLSEWNAILQILQWVSGISI